MHLGMRTLLRSNLVAAMVEWGGGASAPAGDAPLSVVPNISRRDTSASVRLKFQTEPHTAVSISQRQRRRERLHELCVLISAKGPALPFTLLLSSRPVKQNLH